jgi:methylmalonyl-CoA mutase
LCFRLENTLDGAAFGEMLAGIHPDFIGLHFAGKAVDANPGILFSYLSQVAAARNVKAAQCKGSMAYDPVLRHEIVDWRYLSDLMQFVSENFPDFAVVSMEPEPGDAPVADIVSLLRRGNLYLEKLSERGVAPARAAAHLQFDLPIGKSYFYEIARMRAFKLLWLHILKAWNAPLALPATAVHFRKEVYADDLYTNMIRATTMAMSAVLGGADRLTVLPYDAGREALAQYPPAFGRRIARNVQHLLQLESGLGDMADPAAGSYYIEKLTQQLAAAAWEQFRS